MKQSDLTFVEKPVNIFVSRFHPDVLGSEIQQFAQTQFKSATTVIVEKLKTKFDTYSSFKIFVAKVPANKCLDLEQWPTEILVKNFSTLQNPKILHLSANLLIIPMETTNNIELKVVSFNCRGLSNLLEETKTLFKTFDIVLLQETWLAKQNLDFLNSINNQHYS